MEATGRVAVGVGRVAAGALTAGADREPVEAGPDPIAFFSAALMISSLIREGRSVFRSELLDRDLLK